MKKFCFTVDDNVRFFKELTANQPPSLFDHPYLAMYRRLHRRFGLKVQLNLFYEMEDFTLSQMPDRYRREWEENAHWLRMSFHSRLENVDPYANSGYSEVLTDCEAVQREILRFATSQNLAKTTTVHYCLATAEGLRALRDSGVQGLLGLYGTHASPRSSYQTTEAGMEAIREGEIVTEGGMAYSGIDVILNGVRREEISARLNALQQRELIKVMIHEQYFYPDYPRYQPDFEEKLTVAFSNLVSNGYQSAFFEECLKDAGS